MLRNIERTDMDRHRDRTKQENASYDLCHSFFQTGNKFKIYVYMQHPGQLNKAPNMWSTTPHTPFLVQLFYTTILAQSRAV